MIKHIPCVRNDLNDQFCECTVLDCWEDHNLSPAKPEKEEVSKYKQ